MKKILITGANRWLCLRLPHFMHCTEQLMKVKKKNKTLSCIN